MFNQRLVQLIIIVSMVIISNYFLAKVVPGKLKQEKDFNNSRYSKYYDEASNSYKDVAIYYNEKGVCIKNCYLEGIN